MLKKRLQSLVYYHQSHQVFSSRFLKNCNLNHYRMAEEGFALPLALGLGFVMVVLGMSTMIMAQNSQIIALGRKQNGASLAVAEGGMARTLAQLTRSENKVFLNRNYDPINPDTGTTYFGPDGMLNTGDEEQTTVDEWSNVTVAGNSNTCSSLGQAGSPNISYNGTIGADGQYTLKAYRYNPSQKTGTVYIEGKRGTATTRLLVTMAVEEQQMHFPGLIALEKADFKERSVLGNDAFVYYDPAFSADPSLVGAATPSSPNRSQYLDAVKATVDNIEATLVACKLTTSFSYSPQGTNIGVIDDTTSTLTSTESGITHYRAEEIDLEDHVVNVDTTAGPVYLYLTKNKDINMKGTAKLRNIRTDGLAPQVGDFRIFTSADKHIDMEGPGCIEKAFIYAPSMKLHLKSSGGGCSSSVNATIEGVAWVKEVDGESGSTAGVIVPDDMSSLSDVVDYLNLTGNTKFDGVKSWQILRK